ncbi:MAG TPA: beta-ketoacyl synthase N-terminal-like domain-containing protein, partial [Pseudonocardiaceae bacterium]|nr:beta-ketoacyl synthase N-terminal-like domain-containing protein [Pseudonocardiaceae bacterium]
MDPERSRAPDTPQPAAEPIAIIGLSCRFPGGRDAGAFWRLLAGGGDAVTEIPRDRWDVAALYDPDLATAGTMNSRWGGFVDGVDQFEPQFFGLSAGEAASMDPQHRLLLEVTWEALERAGVVPARLAGSATGVFVGIGTDDYASVGFDDLENVNAYYVTGNALSIAVNRLSYLLDLRGPSLALDTGCSSSLVAVHLACQSLRCGESQVALAGGVNVILSPKANIGLSQSWMMAADGRCKSFDASADGYVRGEGCGMVVLKRLADAQRDGDPVLAVVRGSALNQNGRGEALTAPNAQAQEAVIRQALRDAGVTPDQVDMVEAHGVGTPLADAVEGQALVSVFGAQRPAGQPCALGSVKANIGHLELAAGVASLVKVVLALQHEAVPPHLHLRTLNPATGLDGAPFVLPPAPLAWRRGERERVCGINSFGLGGVNVHMVVSEAPAGSVDRSGDPSRSSTQVLPLSARSMAALRALATRYVALLRSPDAPGFAAACATASSGRTHFKQRLAVVAPDAATAADRLAAWLDGGDVPDVYQGVAGDPGDGQAPREETAVDGAARARLFVAGADPQLPEDAPQRRVVLPTYPFQRRRYWVGSAAVPQRTDADRAAQPTALVRQVSQAAPSQRRELLMQAVGRLVAQALGLDDDVPVDPDRGLFELGMTSLMALNLRGQLQRVVGDAHKLPPTLVIEYPSVAALSGYLGHQVFGLEPAGQPVPSGRAASARTLTVDQLSALSDDEAWTLLLGRLQDAATDGGPELSLVKQALLGLDRQSAGSGRPGQAEPVAVVGLGCRFPGGADGPGAFWGLLERGGDAVGEVPGERWDVDAFYDPDPDAPGKMYTRSGSFIDGIDRFDAAFFGISPREAVSLDPQQRLLLEVAWEALEHAGQVPARLAGSRTGVFVGLISNEYMQLQLKLDDPSAIGAYYGTGGIGSAVAGRLSYLLGLHGPSMAVDTACSSSLVAVHLAARSLRSGECDLALAGGVNLMIVPESNIFLSKARAISPDGRCKTFDASADGYGRGEGCGVVVLKRLSDAQRDGDRVLAVVLGSAV